MISLSGGTRRLSFDIEGYELVEGTHYTVSFTPSPVKDAGDYTLTITANGNGITTFQETVNMWLHIPTK